MDDRQLGLLMKTAQNAFADELGKRIEEMDKLLSACGDKCNEGETQAILRFFHSLNGTAATLGLGNLAAIGREWESKIKKWLEQGNDLDAKMIANICEEVGKIKKKMRYTEENSVKTARAAIGIDHPNPADRGKVLLVDDDVAILKLLENALIAEGYTVYICDDSASVLDLIAVTKPDIIILDMMMPKINGLELLAKIKTKAEYADIHVIFLSVINSVDDKIKCIKSGADDYITKPFIIDEVIVRIEAILRRSAMRKIGR